MTSQLPILVVHAGAGEWSDDRDGALAACSRALTAGTAILQDGGSSLDAVVAAVRVLEDDPLCNAGTGAVLTSAGDLKLDASVMDGSTLRSGAVGALPPFEHPVEIARAVLDDGRYHLLTGEGAAEFAQSQGNRRAEPEAMTTDRRRDELKNGKRNVGNTVGAVACDMDGRLAGATSTGGISGTDPGRLGDTPIVGAGTYANDRAACSCTGDGEAFARACAAFDATENASRGIQSAADNTIHRVKKLFGGQGGLILVDRDGGVAIARTEIEMPYGIARSTETFLFGA